MASKWEIACKPEGCWPDGFIFIDKNGYVMPDMNSDERVSRPRRQNIYDHLVSRWDQKALRNAMNQAIESVPQFIIVSFRFIDEVKNYRCKVFRSGSRFFIGGCRESNNLALFPPQVMSA